MFVSDWSRWCKLIGTKSNGSTVCEMGLQSNGYSCNT